MHLAQIDIHLFGTEAFSLGENVRLQDGDEIAIDFPLLGLPLRNRVNIAREAERFVEVHALR